MNTNLKLSFRALWAKKSFSLLNIFGLAIGIGTSLLIFLVIRHETSFDSWQTKKDRLYRVVTTFVRKSNGEVSGRHTMAVRPLANALRQTFPGIEKVGVTQDMGDAQIYIPVKNGEEKRVKEKGAEQYFVEPEVFDIFDFTWLAGSAKELNAPNTVVLTEKRAKAYFGSVAAAMGKTIELWSYRVPLRVVGVFKDLPENTDLPIKMGASFVTFVNMYDVTRRAMFTNDWVSLAGGSQCWLTLRPGITTKSMDASLSAFVAAHFIDKSNVETNTTLSLQPFTSMHLDPHFPPEYTAPIGRRELWALALIGIFLLLVACINFINLATAQSVTRAKEVGVRKALGCDRSLLLKQFLSETALITAVAIVVGVLIAIFTIPALSRIINKPIFFDWAQLPVILVFLFITGVLVTLLAGSYPAMVLSGYNPVVALKSRININQRKNGISLRRGLVIFQFVIAQLLVISTLVVVKQMNFFRNQSMGFKQDAIMLVDLPSDSALKVKYRYLESRVAALPGVVSVALGSQKPSTRSGYYSNVFYDNRPNAEQYGVKRISADSGYFRTFDLKLAAGRYPFPADSLREVLVNEVLVKKLGLKSNNEIIGKMIAVQEGGPYVPVVGVLADFHNNPLNEEIAPAVVTTEYDAFNLIAVRMDPAKVLATSKLLRETFTEIYPTYLYDSSFVEDDIARFYQSEAMIEMLFKIFAFLGIFISCLGLYGLISFMAVQKTKEVGIRKVLGASIHSILYLFSKEFTVLIGIAFLIAAPLGYYFMREWLSGYYYHTEMGWGIFLAAVMMSIVIAWVTVGYKVVKAALANPVKSLRSE
jgi:predicted permease